MRSHIHDGELVTLGLIAWVVAWSFWGSWSAGFLLFTVAIGAALGHRAHWAWRVGQWEDDCDHRLDEIERSTRKAPPRETAAGTQAADG